jgi:hypothetical protein
LPVTVRYLLHQLILLVVYFTSEILLHFQKQCPFPFLEMPISKKGWFNSESESELLSDQFRRTQQNLQVEGYLTMSLSTNGDRPLTSDGHSCFDFSSANLLSNNLQTLLVLIQSTRPGALNKCSPVGLHTLKEKTCQFDNIMMLCGSTRIECYKLPGSNVHVMLALDDLWKSVISVQSAILVTPQLKSVYGTNILESNIHKPLPDKNDDYDPETCLYVLGLATSWQICHSNGATAIITAVPLDGGPAILM